MQAAGADADPELRPLPWRPATLAEIDTRPADDPSRSVDDESESSIVVVERQPMKPRVLVNTMFACGLDLARPDQEQDLIDLDAEASGDDRGVDLEGPIRYLDIL
jgi:hypothetical protein